MIGFMKNIVVDYDGIFSQKLFEGQSDFQKVSVYDTKSHGRMLFNDDLAMVSERDESSPR